MSDTIIETALDGNVLVIETREGRITYDSKFLVAALLVFMARGSGRIEPEETAVMLDLIQSHFRMQGAESLELLTRAMTEMAERPDLGPSLAKLASTLSEREQEDIALMALKVIAADGRREFEEMEQFNTAVEAAGISSEIVHRAFDRFFAETMPGS
ncbi:MAG: TerB family tellurite resistance protein [Woeseiaceae bacterium]|nr:TerB family tellurite resistance protein [Woeseiaceae bacterium]